jgi:hypothetical protein
MTDQFNLVTDFIHELLAELNIPADEAESSGLMNTLEERVNSRLFLDIITSLTPEQAALVADDLASENSDADTTMAKLIDQLPHLQATVAQSLGHMRIELLADLKQ